MNIQPVNDFKAASHFSGRENSNVTSPKKEKHQQEKKGYSGAQVGGAVFATALSAAVLGGAVMRGKGQKVINKLNRENSTLRRTASDLEYEVKKGLQK